MSRFLCSIVWLGCVAAAVPAAARHLELTASVRQPEQLAAFYSARGFTPEAVAAITRACFVTIGIYNHGPGVVWLEPARWRFETLEGAPVQRIDRESWESTWERLGLPLAARATFGWTQLPESRDLQPGEPVGGNVALMPPAGPFRLIARFRTGERGEGEPIELRVEGLSCPREAAP